MSDHTPNPAPSSGPSGELRQALAAGKKKKRTLLVSLVVVVAAAIVAGVTVFAVNLSGAEAQNTAAERLSVRIATAEDTEFQDAIRTAAAEKGLDVEWVNVDDWVLPNTELVAGTVDANAFQHILFLSAFNVESNADITPLFSTVITQWGIFSATLDDFDDLADGARIAIPDDPSNGGRALSILEAAGLIELSDDAGEFPLVEDVSDNPKGLQFVELPARSIVQQFDDPSLAAVVVGTSYFDPSQNITKDDALFLDDSLAEQNLPYVNVVATRADNVDNPAWKILEEAYADVRATDALEKESFGSTVPVKVDVKVLRDKLADLEELNRAG